MNNKPPNISALYDFYRYASGGIVPKKAKPVGKEKTVPTALDWGPNAPMDYLAYLNKQEMALIQKHRAFKGKRSHEGIPAFPDPGTTGYGDRGQGTTSSSGLGGGSKGGYNSGTSGSKGGGASTQSPGAGGNAGQVGGNLGGGGKGGNGSQAPGNTDTGGQRGAGSNYGLGSGRPTVGSSGGSGPTSPMSGQGQSFRSPMGAGWANRDIIDKQRSEVQNARGALQSTSALKTDLQVGGIRSLSVGPMGTNVNVSQPLKAAPPSNPNPAKTNISQSISTQFPSFKYNAPLTPGASPTDMARRVAEMNRIEQEIRDIMAPEKYRDVTPTGTPIEAGGIPTVSRGLPEPEIPMAVREYNPYDIRGARQPYGTERIMGVETVPNETIVDKSRRTRSIGPDDTNPYDAQIRAHIEAMNQVAAKNAAMNYGGFSLDPEQDVQREAIDRGLSESVMNASLKSNVSQPESTDTVSADGGRRGAGSNYGPKSGRPGIVGSSGGSGPTSPNENVADEPKAISQSMNPMQDDWGDIQRPKGFVEKYGKHVPNVFVKAAIKGYGYVEDKKWSNMSPEERLAQLSRGVRPTGAPSGMGQDNDRGEEFRPPSSRANESTTGTRPPKPKGNGPRPAIYYKWDLGVDVPSPTDSDYTLYTKYLQEKAAARAGFA
jgi:hypothetical protein